MMDSEMAKIELELAETQFMDSVASACLPRQIIDPFHVIGLDIGASPKEISTKYKKWLVGHHPDKTRNLSPEMQDISSAVISLFGNHLLSSDAEGHQDILVVLKEISTTLSDWDELKHWDSSRTVAVQDELEDIINDISIINSKKPLIEVPCADFTRRFPQSAKVYDSGRTFTVTNPSIQDLINSASRVPIALTEVTINRMGELSSGESFLYKPWKNNAVNNGDSVSLTSIIAGWSISRQDIHVGTEIGKGNFGSVMEATYQGRKVAVKMIMDTEKAGRTFLDEASIMTQLRHPNLVELIGVAIGSPIYVVLEFMSKGNLLDYLRTRGRAIITQKTQLGFAKNVCDGMKYLESRNFVHRDLAARNILISERDIAKVSDFGLAQDDQGHGEGSSKIPVKWTAPEAVREKNFSTKSDVWSFGVLIWELYSFGRVPYPRVPADEVILFIEEGSRMQAPDECPPRIYQIMKDCWRIKPRERSSFREICDSLNSMDMPETSV